MHFGKLYIWNKWIYYWKKKNLFGILFFTNKDYINNLCFWNSVLNSIWVCWIVYVRSFLDRNKVNIIQLKYRWWVYSNIYCNRLISTTKISWTCQHRNWWNLAFRRFICCSIEHAFRRNIKLALFVFYWTLWSILITHNEA